MHRRDDNLGGPRKGGLVRAGIRSVSGGIGLVSESVKARKESPAGRTGSQEQGVVTSSPTLKEADESSREQDPPPRYSPHGPEEYKTREERYEGDTEQGQAESGEDLEDEWNLDDAQDEISGESLEKDDALQRAQRENELEETTFLRDHPIQGFLQQQQASSGRLPLPVILPQRRPKDRSRGFIRAYPPMLAECGIDQATWLAFLDSFQKSSAANPWLNAINLASIATMFIPHGIGTAVGWAIQQATNLAIELQARERTNAFLYKINEEFFRPRGLYCLVMTWNPESKEPSSKVNLSATIASRSSAPAPEGLTGLPAKFRNSDGKTYGECEFPETAPLVFPALDRLAAQTDTEHVQEKKSMAKKLTFVANYWDKRATAEYAMTNPDSVLAQVPQGEFHSRYADPNNHASSGSLISFVSGGRLVPEPRSRGLVGGLVSVVGQAVRGEKQGSAWQRTNEGVVGGQSDGRERYMKNRYGSRRRDPARPRDGLISAPVGAAKRLLKQNVLYLMVVNLPSDEELAATKAAAQS